MPLDVCVCGEGAAGNGASCMRVQRRVMCWAKDLEERKMKLLCPNFCHRFRVVTQSTARIQACDIKSSLCRILQNCENEFFCFPLNPLKSGALSVWPYSTVRNIKHLNVYIYKRGMESTLGGCFIVGRGGDRWPYGSSLLKGVTAKLVIKVLQAHPPRRLWLTYSHT